MKNALKLIILLAVTFVGTAKTKKTAPSAKKSTASSTPSAKEENRAPVDDVKFAVLLKAARTSNEVLDQMAKMETLRATAENSLALLLKGRPTDLELNLRLAELHLNRARDFEQFALELSLLGQEAKAKELQKTSTGLFETGLRNYKVLLPRVKNHPMEGEIYLGLARSLKSLRRYKEALGFLKSIENRKYPQRTQFFIALIEGDLEFILSNAKGAKVAYDRAETYVAAGTPEALYLTYKKAWVLYNLKDTHAAVALLKKVVEASKDRLALAQEAVQDFSLFAADLSTAELATEGGVRGVYRYLAGYSRPEIAERAMEKLSETYSLNGRRSEAKATLEFLIELNPNSNRNGERALTVVKYDQDRADTKALAAKYMWLIKNFGPLSAWYKAQKLRPDIQRNTYDAIEESLRTYAVNLHKEANVEKSDERRRALEETVATLYDEHLANFKEVPRINYYRAELYRRSKDYEKAAIRYDRFILNLLAYDESKLEDFDIKLKKEAALGAVETWAKAIDQKPKLTESMLKACDRFVDLFPKDVKAPVVALDAARVEFKTGNPEIALKRIQKLVKDYPQSPEAAEGVNAGLDILNKQGDFVNLAAYAREWKEKVALWSPAAKKSEMTGQLDKVLSTSEAKSCEVMSKRKDKKLEAALCFRRVADTVGNSDIAPKSLVLASELFTAYGDPFSALEALEELVQKHPNSPQAIVAFSKLAEGFERTFQFSKSADIYEKLLTRKDVPNRKQVLQRLASLYSGLGEKAKLEKLLTDADAGQDLKNHVFEISLKADHDELLNLERTEGYTKGHFASARAQAIYEHFLDLEKKSKLPTAMSLEMQRIAGHLVHSQGNMQKADEIWMAGLKKFWRTSPKTPALWESAARMRLSQGSYWRSRFNSAELASSPQRKVAMFQKLEAWNAEVLGMNSPAVALETLWQTAKLYQDFANEIKSTQPKMSEDLSNKSKLVTQELARRAQNWGIISPLLLSVLSELRAARGHDTAVKINFPWPELPRALDMASDKKNYSEWQNDVRELDRTLVRSKDRREQRRVAYVLLTKKNSLSGIGLHGWEDLLTGKDEVQGRIQAALQDNANDKAELLLGQYNSVYGDDLFSAIAASRLEVNKREYSDGYRRALALFQQGSFAGAYYAIGWKSLFDELTEGQLSDGFKKEAFSVLQGKAKVTWEKQLLATLCLKGTITCEGSYVGSGLLALVNETKNESLADFQDHRSLWRVKEEFLELALRNLSRMATGPEQIQILRNGLETLRSMSKGALDAKTVKQAVNVAESEIKKAEVSILAKADANRKISSKQGEP